MIKEFRDIKRNLCNVILMRRIIKLDPFLFFIHLPPRCIFRKLNATLKFRVLRMKKISLEFLFPSHVCLYEMLIEKIYYQHKDFIPKRNWIVFDIGAYLGVYSILSAYMGAIVYAFEPILENYILLLVNLSMNANKLAGKVIPRKFAIGNYLGKAFMLKRGRCSRIVKKLSRRCEEVKIITIDEFCRRNDIKFINLMKIDTEGYELQVLKGAQHMLAQHKIEKIISSNYHYLEEDKIVTRYLEKYNYKKVLTRSSVSYYEVKF